MKPTKLIIVFILLFCITNNLCMGQVSSSVAGGTIGNKVNQTYENKKIITLSKGFEIKKMQLPFTEAEAEYVVQKIGHNYIMDGDIIVGNDLPKTQSYSIGTGIYKNSYKWQNGEVPIEIDNSIYFNDMEKSVFDAMDELNDKLPLKFVFKSNQTDYIKISAKDEKYMGFAAGYSSIGKQGNEQDIVLLTGMNDKTILMHEMLHAIGIFHEMSREDRDQFIKINVDNIKPEAKNQFNTVKGLATGDFDFCSIMLYGQHTSANINEKSAWDRIDKDKNIINLPNCNNINSFSNIDIDGVKKIYGDNLPSKIKVDRNNLPAHIIKIRGFETLRGSISWHPSVGMPNGRPEDMFIINLLAYSAFDETAPYNTTYMNSKKNGHFINLKNTGKLTFSKIDNESENSFKGVVFTIEDVPKDVPLQFSIELNPTCQWIGTKIPQPALLTTYLPILTILDKYYTEKIPADATYHANVSGEISGQWVSNAPKINTIDSKILQPKPGVPVMKEKGILKNLIKQ